MKSLGVSVIILFGWMACATVVSADTLQLRNGRHLQGKYIGGTSTAIGFMSGASVEYFPTADVLVLMFDNSADPALGGTQPSPMSGDCSMGAARVLNTGTHLDPTLRQRSIPFPRVIGPDSQPDRRSFALGDELWFSTL